MDKKRRSFDLQRVFCLPLLLFFCAAAQLFGAEEKGYYSSLFALPESTVSSAEVVASDASLSADGFCFSEDVILRGALGLKGCRAFQIWGNYYVGGGKINPAGIEKGFGHDITGYLLGATIGVGSVLSISGYFNYQQDQLDRDRIENEATARLGGVGLRLNAGLFYFSGLGNYSDDKYQMRGEYRGKERDLDYDGWQATGLFETGFDWSTGGGLFTLTPFSNFQYSTIKYDQVDRGHFCLTGEKDKYDAHYQTLGSRVDLDIFSILGIQGRLAWVHQYNSEKSPIINYQFSRVPGTLTPTTTFYEGNGGRDWFWGGVGARISLFDIGSISLDYDVLVNKYQTNHLGSVGVLIGF